MSDKNPGPKRVSKNLWRKMKPLAREKRREPTHTENLFWQELRNRKLNGLKFRRQHVIEHYFVDFYCAEARLIIEVDGEIHEYQQEDDQVRQEKLESSGSIVIRFSNDDILNNMQNVLQQIQEIAAQIIKDNAPDSPSL
jgi:very-short-patch-repair endonuclease